MPLALALVILVGVTAGAITLMLVVRRTAPDGGYFADGDRASGVFGVLAAALSVLLGFLIFLAFDSYDSSRAGAEAEALVVAQQVEAAQLLPSAASADLTGELVCYARWVIDEEWARMRDGTLGADINPWSGAMFHTIETIEPSSSNEEAAYGQWLELTSTREEARRDRVHGAAGLVPTPLWGALFFITLVVVLYMLFFADSTERAVVQAMLMGSVVAVITSMLLLLNMLDDPFQPGAAGIDPTAMERTLVIIDQQLAVVGMELDPPCGASGAPA